MKKTESIVLTSLFAALLAVCAQLTIPLAVPFTMQTFALYASLLILGSKRTFAAVGTYLALGAVGAPVFSGFKGGVGTLFGPNGGFLLSFLPACLVFAFAVKILKDSKCSKIVGLIFATIFCYLAGTLWFAFVYGANQENLTLIKALSLCVFPFVIPDCAKIMLSLMFAKRVKKRIKI